jgi:hypothetical protein
MKVFVCVKVGIKELPQSSEEEKQTLVQTEAAFLDRTKAEAFYMDRVKIWKEFIEGASFECVRALHEIDVTE